MSDDAAAPPDLEVGLSFVQARAIVQELDALWSNSNVHGKKKVRELRRLRETLATAVGDDHDHQTD